MDQNLVERFIDSGVNNQQFGVKTFASNKLILNEPLELFPEEFNKRSIWYRIYENSTTKKNPLSNFIKDLTPSGNCLGVLTLSVLYDTEIQGDLTLVIESKIFESLSKQEKLSTQINLLSEVQFNILLDGEKPFQFDYPIYKNSSENGEYGRLETVHFNLKKTDFKEIVNAKTFDFRVNAEIGVLVENRLPADQFIELLGFYKTIFDNQFDTSLLKDDDGFSNRTYLDDKLMAIEVQGLFLNDTLKETELLVKQVEAQNRNSKSDSSCFIVTATMNNDPNNYIVDDFRKYRDQYLKPSFAGKVFIQFYYIIGPIISLPIKYNQSLQKLSYNYFVAPIYKRIKNKV
jgi:hypothetical protein